MTVNGRTVKALVQLTKQGYAYVLDRVTGQPVWPIEERPVPASDVPGERAWPTQPHPTKPAAYDYQGYNENDLIDFTPELRAEAVKIAKQYRLGPAVHTPVGDQAERDQGHLVQSRRHGRFALAKRRLRSRYKLLLHSVQGGPRHYFGTKRSQVGLAILARARRRLDRARPADSEAAL
jgi:hypothetical protein